MQGWADLDLKGAIAHLGHFWANQIGGTFLSPGSTLSIGGLVCTLPLAAFLAVPRGRRTMPRLAVWRRALFPARLWRSASGRADIAWFAFSLLGFGLAFSWAMLSASTIAAAIARMLGPAHPMPALPGALLLTGALYLAYEFAYWVDHMLKHKVAVLWQFHRVHHSAESLSLLTNFRVHPVDTIIFYNIVAVALGATGGTVGWLTDAQPWTIGGTNALVMGSAILLTHLQHSHLWVQFGPRLNRWLLSPAHHQIHHSAAEAHFDRNFGSTLALWDRLFGTLHVPAARREAIRFGLEDEAAPHGLHAATLGPFTNAWRLLNPVHDQRSEPPRPAPLHR